MLPPPCPACLVDDGTPGAVLCREECDEYPAEVRLICAACGHGYRGTDAEVEQAKAADAARCAMRAASDREIARLRGAVSS